MFVNGPSYELFECLFTHGCLVIDGFILFHFKKDFERKTYKILFINTLLIRRIPKGIRKNNKNLKDIKSTQTKCQNLSILTINRL
jgi:hypothetical protein